MGRGDRSTKRGKLWRGTFGKSRPTEQKRRAQKRNKKKSV
ncbi:MAG: 30S ribosomal protein THX [Planctomycetota bacterium]|jgi:30S ribosomal protein S31